MATKSLDRLLAQLEEARYCFGRGDGSRVVKILQSLGAAEFPDATSLIRFHETLMFLRAFPQEPGVVRKTERLLNQFHKRVDALRKSGADLSALDPLEVSGIAGTKMSDTLSYDLARWLVRRMPDEVTIDWDNWDEGRAMGEILPRVLPLVEDDALVEADTPWRKWMEAACPQALKPRREARVDGAAEAAPLQNSSRRGIGGVGIEMHYESGRQGDVRRGRASAGGTGEGVFVQNDRSFVADKGRGSFKQGSDGRGRPSLHQDASVIEWLIGRFEDLPVSLQARAQLYDSLRVPLTWDLDNSRVSRTRNWTPAGGAVGRDSSAGPGAKIFYHSGPLISRSEVSLAEELAKRPPVLHRLSRKQGEPIIDKIREVMLVRYRELYGTTLGDPAAVVSADIGRGMSIYLWNLPPERRLPLRAYVAGLTLKNGVPINYIEAIGLFEWTEVGFNTFYTFRGGEAGWIYSQVLRCLCHLMGTTCVSMYPYQLGHENEEALKSGAFWFYRKLGFRPGSADLLRLVEREEKKIAADSSYRTSIRTLKRLAQSHAFYELPGSEKVAWDGFSTRNIGLRANARMATEFGGDSEAMREHGVRTLEKLLGVKTSSWSSLEKTAFENFAFALTGVAELRTWSREEKQQLVEVIRAKANVDEMLYLHLTQRHHRLREVMLKMGKNPRDSGGGARGYK